MKRLLPILMGFVFLLLSSTEGWSLPPCPEKGDWNNCFGTYTSDDGTKYVGEWKNDQFHGQGTETYANGDKYVGQWKDGKYHGQGIKTYADGRVEKGEWENNKYVKIPSKEVGVAASAKQIETKVKKLSKADLKPLPSSGKAEMALGKNMEMPTTIYMPGGVGPKPMILVIHSSGGLMPIYHKYAVALQKKGLISVVPDFFTPYDITLNTKRLTWTEHRKAIHADFQEIISQVRKMTEVAPKQVFAVGFSNGGYWAAALASNGDVDAGVSYYGAYSEGGTIGKDITRGSIYQTTDPKSSPILMFHGYSDRVVPVIVAEKFEKMVRSEAGDSKIEAHYYGGVDHAFENKIARGGKMYDAEATKDAWEKTLIFLKKNGAKLK
jgi:dienelactone hydrolase